MVKRSATLTFLLLVLVVPATVRGTGRTFERDLRFLIGKTFDASAPRGGGPAGPGADRPVPEYKLLFVAAVRIYRSTLSSQDMSVCNFTPTCSRFSEDAIRKAGFVRGLLLTSDRLQRCNGSGFRSRDYYPYDPISGKLLDPVERYIGNR